MYSNIKLPKTIILAVNVHGGSDSIDCINQIDKEEFSTYPVTKIPSKIKNLIKIDAVPWGNDIIIDSNELNKFLKIIRDELLKIYLEDVNLNRLEYFVEKAVEKIKNFYYNKYQSKKKFLKYKSDGEDINDYINVIEEPTFSRCLMNKDICRINKMIGGELMVNKIFCYEKKDWYMNRRAYFKKISILNFGLELDLFDLMENEGLCAKYQMDGLEIELNKLLEFLETKQVENIVMFDFSCSSLLPDDKFTPRDIRRFRREIYFGLNNKRYLDNDLNDLNNSNKSNKKIKK